MPDEMVPSQDAVHAFELELARTGVVELRPSMAQAVSNQVPALLAVCVGAWLVPQVVEGGGVALWITTVLLLAVGVHGAWQLCLGLWGAGRHPVRVSADGLHDQATDARLAWSDITGVELRERRLRGITTSRRVVLTVQPARLGATSLVELPASLPEPVSLRKWLEEELSRRGRP